MKNKNRWFVSVLCAVAAMLCVLGLSACKKKGHVHEWGEWEVAKEATCSEAGKRMRTCSGCTEVETEAIEKTAHDWNDATCTAPKTCKVCSATEGDALGHTYDKEVVSDKTLKTAATCTSPAIYYKSCKCGAVSTSADDTFTYGDCTKHPFVNGTCPECGYVWCDHKTMHTKTLDLHELGLCASVFTYQICDCGTVVETDDDFFDSLNCPIDRDVWEAAFPESEAESGEAHGEVTCEKCGLNIGITMQFGEEGCLSRARYVITLKKDDKVLLDQAVLTYEHRDHFEVREEIPLDKADGFCGGTLAVLKCKECGEITKKLALKPTCKFDFVHGLTETEETDANGVKHTIARGVCPDCGLTKEFDTWLEKDGCNEIFFTAERIYRGDRMLLSMTGEELQKSHIFIPTFEALGDGGCQEDGAKITYRCATCNLSFYSYRYNHIVMSDTIGIKELGGCDTQISVQRCAACGEVDYFNPEYDVRENGCQMKESSRMFTDGDGVVHTVTTDTCSECGLQIIVDAWKIRQGNNGSCGYIGYELYRVIYGGQELISYRNMVDVETTHDWDTENATYESDTPDMACGDSFYTVTLTCKECGETQTLQKYGHDMVDVGIELIDYGCGGYVGGWRCMRCGDLDSDYWHFDCEDNGTLVWSTTPTETTDKNGLVHKTWTGSCSACGLKFIREAWTEQFDEFGCTVRNYVKYQIFKNGKAVLEFRSDEVVDKHNDDEHMKTVYDREGACEDGYYKTTYCPTCGLASAEYEDRHKEEYRSVDGKELGFCEGSFVETYCVACGEILHQQARLECDFVWDDDTQKSKTCSVCGAKILYIEKAEQIDPCHRIAFTEEHYINQNGEDVYLIVYQSRFTTHKEEYRFELNGTSCSEGYRVRKVCSVCNEVVQDWEERTYHDMYDLFVLDNTEGVCESHVGAVKVRGCVCGYWCAPVTGDLAPVGGVEDGNTTTSRYECPHCNLKLVETVTVTVDGCRKITARTVRITLGEKELYSGEGTAVTPQHSFGSFELIEAENGLTLRTICEHCGKNADTEIAQAIHPEGRTDWSYVFTPAVSGTYTFQLLVNKKIEFSEKNGDLSVRKDYDPNGRIQVSLKAGQTYKLSWAESETPEKWEAYIAILPDHTDCESSANNNGCGALLPGSETCEDGMLYWNYCSYCGTIANYDSLKIYCEHKTWHWYYTNPAFCGFGQFGIDECACGEQFEIRCMPSCKEASPEILESESFGGCKLEKFSCAECGLNYEVYYKETTNGETGDVTIDYLYAVIRVHDEVVYSLGTPPTKA